jgi:NitT/TauT family transport system ATP-binding protein
MQEFVAHAIDPTVAPIGAGHRPLIRAAGISKIYQDGTVALAALDFTIDEGEFVSLLGPSGCGKSTFLRLVAGLGGPSSGRIEWPRAGYAPADAWRSEIGFVFQEPTLMPWKTVFENVYLPLKVSGIVRRNAQERVNEALAMVNLEKFAHAYPRQLSGGMKMRASIARALIVKPRIVLLDEPFAALDEITRFRLNDDLLRLWQAQQWTVIFVTHSVFESAYLSNRVLVMSARPGRIFADLPIDAPYPRGPVFRTSTTYNDICQLISAELARAMAASALAEETLDDGTTA